MNSKKITQLILIVWLIISFCFVVKSEYTLNLGKDVLLKTVPVDPRDILMGDYVILNYEISQFPKQINYSFKYDEPVYVELKLNDDNVAYIDQITKNRPKGLFIKGTVSSCPSIAPILRRGKCISYGIENYYVKEGEGRKLERDLATGALVKVSIDRYGQAKVKGFDKKLRNSNFD